MSVTIYHNPRCSKSRQALEILEGKDIQVNIINYLDDGLDMVEVLDLSLKLGCDVKDFVRTKEEEFKNYKIDWDNNKEAALVLSECPLFLERTRQTNSYSRYGHKN